MNFRNYRLTCKVKCKIKEYQGCTCDHPPKDNKPYKIKHELYFAKESPTWCGHGVAFIKSENSKSKELITLGRIYLITIEQFNDILHQENGRKKPYNDYVPLPCHKWHGFPPGEENA